jgi:hypothetical protein
MIFDLAVNLALAAVDAAVFFAIWKRVRLATPARLIAVVVLAPVLLLPLMVVLGLFAFLRLMAWAIFIHLVILLAGDAILNWNVRRKMSIASAAVALLIAGVGVDAFFIEPHWLEVTRFRITSPKVNRPLKIAIIADIQTDAIGDYERRVLELVKAEHPDLVLFAGDYIQEHDDARRRELIRDLRPLIKECGFKFAVAVKGNVDDHDWPDIFEGTGVECADMTREYRQGEVQITALSLMDSEYVNDAKITPSERFHIVLGHIPNFALGNVQADLLVAGHTHGGQVRLPGIGPLITLSSIPRSWAAGMTELTGGRTLIVSRGIGMERGRAPRLRFLCRPELVILEVVPGP